MSKIKFYAYAEHFNKDFQKVQKYFPQFSIEQLNAFYKISKKSIDEVQLIKSQILAKNADNYGINIIKNIYYDVTIQLYAL